MTDMIPTLINERWELLLPRHRAERAEWAWWEKERTAAMVEVIESMNEPIVFDVGAEEGDLPCLWAKLGAQVVLLEPNAKVWPNIKAIFEANGCKPAGWFVGFAGDETVWVNDLEEIVYSDAYFAESEWPPCADGEVIGDHGFCHLWERPDIPKIRIDDFNIVPDVITIDVEGSELRVLEGATATLTNHRPVVLCSIHRQFMADMYGEDTPEHLLQHMERLDYRPVHIKCDSHEHHWRFDPL